MMVCDVCRLCVKDIRVTIPMADVCQPEPPPPCQGGVAGRQKHFRRRQHCQYIRDTLVLLDTKLKKKIHMKILI